MLSIDGRSGAVCNGVTRRRMLQAGGAGLLGLSLPKVLAAEEVTPRRLARAKSVIFLFLYGGPSQLETFDLKPDAPTDIRGPFKPIACRTPGLIMSESLPRLASISDRCCVVRTLTHDFNDHSGGGHYMQTGHRWHVPIGGGFNTTPKDWPSVGSVVEYVEQHSPRGLDRDLPNYVVLPNRLGALEQEGQYIRPGEYAGWLGRSYNPMNTGIEKKNLQDNPYWRDCTDDELAFQIAGQTPAKELRLDRLSGRRTLLEQLDSGRRDLDVDPDVHSYDRFRRRALALVASERTHKALDLQAEPAKVRERYGKHLFGQSTLMARRLVEAGVRFVTVHYDCCDGYSWDSHVHSDDVKNHLMPTFDQGAAVLIQDLEERGLLDETLVIALGEMGRTPKGNPRWGRNHWSTLFPALLAGGGVKGGITYGSSDAIAEYPSENPVTPEDLAATLYYALGIPADIALPDAQGRPTPIVEGGKPVEAIFG
ncbi:MAG: hypothetical protein K0Q72_2502 [Armatimonadetes bacterium]|jgi:hypothetical protein|nr:hypothetical protein [Armatimonadota bacterium]